jgi:hypothetical protein
VLAQFSLTPTAPLDELQQHDGGADLAVLLRRHCDGDPIEPLAGSSIPANSGSVSWPLGCVDSANDGPLPLATRTTGEDARIVVELGGGLRVD